MSNIYRALIKAAEDIDPGQLSVDENKKKLLNISQQYKELGTDVKQDDAVLYKMLQQEDLRKYLEGPDKKPTSKTKTSLDKKASLPIIIKVALFGRKKPKAPQQKHWTDDYDMGAFLEDCNRDIDKANKYIDKGNATGVPPAIFAKYKL
jgi:hypothetical protein